MASYGRGGGGGAVGGEERNVAAMGARECAGYIAQLKAVLDAAAAEPPPPGVDTAEVERRMALIQATLQEVEYRADEIRRDQQERELQRFVNNQERRAQMEEELEGQRTFTDKQKDVLVKEMRDMQVAYYRDHNGRQSEKALRCKEHKQNAHWETMSKAASNEGRRTQNIQNLMDERERRRRELRDREMAKQRYARDVNRKRAKQMEEYREEKERQAELNAQQVEAKLAAVRDSRRSKWKAKRNASRARSIVVFENGEAILETEAKDHEKLLQDLDAKMKGQQARYAEEKADRDLYLLQRAQFRAMRHDDQQTRLIKLIDKRLQRGETIIEESKVKQDKGDKAKEAQATQYVEAGKELRKDIAQHLRRARRIEEQRHNDALNKNYRRWNHRAARIMADLQTAVDAEGEPARASPDSDTPRYSRYDDRAEEEPKEPRIQIASPDEFSV